MKHFRVSIFQSSTEAAFVAQVACYSKLVGFSSHWAVKAGWHVIVVVRYNKLVGFLSQWAVKAVWHLIVNVRYSKLVGLSSQWAVKAGWHVIVVVRYSMLVGFSSQWAVKASGTISSCHGILCVHRVKYNYLSRLYSETSVHRFIQL